MKNLPPRPLSLGGKGEQAEGPGERFFIAVPHVGGYHHPLAAIYRVEVLPEVRRFLTADRLRPVFLFDVVPTRTVEPHELADIDPNFDSLRNLNTPDDYAKALSEYHQSI